MNNIGEIIKTERKNRNLTQKDLAKLLGVTQDSISLWEMGKRIPDTQYVIEFCKIFDISAGYLLGLEDDFGARVQNAGNSTVGGGELNAKERALLEAFRRQLPETQDFVLRALSVNPDTVKLP